MAELLPAIKIEELEELRDAQRATFLRAAGLTIKTGSALANTERTLRAVKALFDDEAAISTPDPAQSEVQTSKDYIVLRRGIRYTPGSIFENKTVQALLENTDHTVPLTDPGTTLIKPRLGAAILEIADTTSTQASLNTCRKYAAALPKDYSLYTDGVDISGNMENPNALKHVSCVVSSKGTVRLKEDLVNFMTQVGMEQTVIDSAARYLKGHITIAKTYDPEYALFLKNAIRKTLRGSVPIIIGEPVVLFSAGKLYS